MLDIAFVLVNVLTCKLLPNRNIKWIFTKEEMERFQVKEKIEKINENNT